MVHIEIIYKTNIKLIINNCINNYNLFSIVIQFNCLVKYNFNIYLI